MDANENRIAIVGMAARVPGARTIWQFWKNLCSATESVRSFQDEELLKAGVPAALLQDPAYVKSGGVLDEMEHFDAEFFGFNPKEAAIMDPQHRHFLECVWEALEDAGHSPEKFTGPIGIFAGCGMGGYFMRNIITNPELVRNVGMFLLRHTGNDKDFLTTRVSYLLNLRGPSINVQTACSTSLVAVHLACQSLLVGECDLAIAGGVTIDIPHGQGYLYQEGEVLARDGHCRAFDHRSSGTVLTSGTGVVVLRRLVDAREDRDHVYAVIRGSAVNNDGAQKVGYLAPSVDGQASVMAEALAVSGADPQSVAFIECHGTGTYIGDPIEVSALTQAYDRPGIPRKGCALSSVKTNIGHLDTAAGVASLIKVALALDQELIPPIVNFEKPNPNIDFEATPFYVNDTLKSWPRTDRPRLAAVNSLGVGGTNAHAILEESPFTERRTPAPNQDYLFKLSARNGAALEEGARALAQHLRENEQLELRDVTYTLHVGRRDFARRRVFTARTRDEAIRLLESGDPQRVFTHLSPAQHSASRAASIAFMLPGGGSQYARMGFDLYRKEPVYREHIDRGLELLKKRHRIDLRPLLLAEEHDQENADRELQKTALQLPAVFLTSYATAQLWMAKGIMPGALIGHSLGENTAACLAGVFRFEDALALVVLRGKLVERAPPGGMLSVELPEAELVKLLGDDLDLAVVNAPNLCVASGEEGALARLAQELDRMGAQHQRVRISVAGHSRLLDSVLGDFAAYLHSIPLAAPRFPIVSNSTGRFLSDEEAVDPDYWTQHLRKTIRFADGVGTLLAEPARILLEAGPGRMLSSLVKQHSALKPTHSVIPSLRHPKEMAADEAFFLAAFGRLWAAGAGPDLDALWQKLAPRRVPLPAYAFQRHRYFIEPPQGGGYLARDAEKAVEKSASLDDWFFVPEWQARATAPAQALQQPVTWLIFQDQAGIGAAIAPNLRAQGHRVVVVSQGDSYKQKSEEEYVLAPERGREGYKALVQDLNASGMFPQRIIHLWLVTEDESFRPGSSFFHRNQERGFYSLFFFAQVLAEENLTSPLHILAVANGMLRVNGEDLPYPDKATILGPVRVLPREFPAVTCAALDLQLPLATRLRKAARQERASRVLKFAEHVAAEGMNEAGNRVLALRGEGLFEQRFRRAPELMPPRGVKPLLRARGVYLITGGLGGLGMVLAEHLAGKYHARLILVGRSQLPDRSQWDAWLKRQGAQERVSRRILSIRNLERAGAEVEIVSADVTDTDALRESLVGARRRFGTIHGVFHAAGVIKDNLISMKSQGEIEDVFTPKIHGTHVLEELLGDTPLDFFVLYSSSSTAIAPAGQIDYVAANEFLNAFALARANGGTTRTIAINWGIWNEVGIAAEAVDRAQLQVSAGDEKSEPTRYPLFERCTRAGNRTILQGRLSPRFQWILDEHRTLEGSALIPGTAYLELARAALEECGETRPFEVCDLVFFRPLVVGDLEEKKFRVKLLEDNKGYSFETQSYVALPDGRAGWWTHAQANLLLRALPPAKQLRLRAIEDRCTKSRTAVDPDGIRSRQEEHMKFGGRWRVLNQVFYGDGEAIARLSLRSEHREDLQDYPLHPALLDIATGFAMELIEGYAQSHALWVPVSYKRARMHAPLTPEVHSWIRNHGDNSADKEFALFDIVITDADGRVLFEAEEFAIKRVAAGGEFAMQTRAVPHDLEFEAGTHGGIEARALSPAEAALRHNLSRGILPAEGIAALERIMCGSPAPVLFASSLDLGALMQQAANTAKVTTQDREGSKFARPELNSEYVAPRNPIEQALVGIWEDLLGVDQIGVKDSFFDLGGHSLIAVRLFARIKKTFQVDYPISVLFQAPTIELCARLIQDATGGDGESTGAVTRSEPHRPRYTYLVPMHAEHGGGGQASGRSSGRAPFYLVAGMFGNVLNLRHLAHLVGSDRPFYGVQARGLFGDMKPHETFEEMAHDYLEEIFTLQPHGPYFIGGFSGGGITAFEMAHQLRERGEEVALLVFLDSLLPMPPRPNKWDMLRIHWSKLKRGGISYVSTWAKSRYEWEMRKFTKDGQESPAERDPTQFQSDLMENAFRAALPRYQVRHYPGKVVLFRPKLDEAFVLGPNRVANSKRELIFPDNCWREHVGELEIVEVSGDHDSMVLEPNVRNLARKLGRAIEQAEAKRGVSESDADHELTPPELQARI